MSPTTATATSTGQEPRGPDRLLSLDQFRGFAVLGMFVVNFLGGFRATPEALRHHPTYITYADLVMPQFFLAAGFACRLTLLRRRETEGPRAAYLRTVRRCLALLVIGLLLYGIDGKSEHWSDLTSLGLVGFFKTAFQRRYFQTLVHLALTTLWVLPVVAAGPLVRVGFALVSAALHVWFSAAGFYDFVMARPGIDGGALGFLTWTIPFLAGTLAYDLKSVFPPAGRTVRLTVAGVVLMAIGYGLSCLHGFPALAVRPAAPPFVPPGETADLWTMSQRAGSVSYHTFAAGAALAVYALFVLACDGGRIRSAVLDTLGRNALAAYLVHEVIDHAMSPFLPSDAPAWFAVVTLALFIGACVAAVRILDRSGIHLRL